MTARYSVRHLSRYRYDEAITASYNEARLTPAATAWQNPLESVLRVDMATWQYRYLDYWGTQVRVFEASAPHRELVVDASSLVEIDCSRRRPADLEIAWTVLGTAEVQDRLAEYLVQTPCTEPPDDLAELARDGVAGRTPHQAALAVSRAVYEAMTYRPGSTGVNTVAGEAWAARTGVCQDYAHLVVGAMRTLGIPARYVSGYLHPKREPLLGEAVLAESHAWVEWWLGEWHPHDPTNDADVADRHVLVGVGRDYTDVPPVKGTVAGNPRKTELEVEVTVTRLA